MDAFDALQLLNNRSSTNDSACPCTSNTHSFGATESKPAAAAAEDKAPIETHRDLLEMSASALVKEFKRLQEDRVRVFGLFERSDPPQPCWCASSGSAWGDGLTPSTVLQGVPTAHGGHQ